MIKITATELNTKIMLNDNIKLVNAMDDKHFNELHIPGSINVSCKEEIFENLHVDDEIVVYCSDESCNLSIFLYQLLESYNYKNISRFAGGLREWSEAGFVLEGEMA